MPGAQSDIAEAQNAQQRQENGPGIVCQQGKQENNRRVDREGRLDPHHSSGTQLIAAVGPLGRAGEGEGAAEEAAQHGPGVAGRSAYCQQQQGRHVARAARPVAIEHLLRQQKEHRLAKPQDAEEDQPRRQAVAAEEEWQLHQQDEQ